MSKRFESLCQEGKCAQTAGNGDLKYQKYRNQNTFVHCDKRRDFLCDTIVSRPKLCYFKKMSFFANHCRSDLDSDHFKVMILSNLQNLPLAVAHLEKIISI